jgi:hypothetical protein
MASAVTWHRELANPASHRYIRQMALKHLKRSVGLLYLSSNLVNDL